MYSIGQVIFVILSKKNQIYPMRVIEIITKKMLTGEETSYILQAGGDMSTRITVDQVDGEIFDSAEKARKMLIQRASMQINKIVDAAILKSNEWYGETNQETTSSQSPVSQSTKQDVEETKQLEPPKDQNYTTVQMPDGSFVKVRMPSILGETD